MSIYPEDSCVYPFLSVPLVLLWFGSEKHKYNLRTTGIMFTMLFLGKTPFMLKFTLMFVGDTNKTPVPTLPKLLLLPNWLNND